MTEEEMIDRLDGIFAFDSGTTDSGIFDPSFKEEVKKDKAKLDELLKKLVGLYIAEEGRTFEDVQQIVEWARDEMDMY